MEVWFDGSADGRCAAWAALILNHGNKPRLIYGTGRNIPSDNADRWAARQILRRFGKTLPDQVRVFSDRQGLRGLGAEFPEQFGLPDKVA